jgi:PAS domain-containing protein
MQQQPLPVRPPHPKQTAFEFTKRKRWADLLVTELTEAIILILDPNCHILYCGAAVNELLGWRDDEVVDGDFIELINGLQYPFMVSNQFQMT